MNIPKTTTFPVDDFEETVMVSEGVDVDIESSFLQAKTAKRKKDKKTQRTTNKPTEEEKEEEESSGDSLMDLHEGFKYSFSGEKDNAIFVGKFVSINYDQKNERIEFELIVHNLEMKEALDKQMFELIKGCIHNEFYVLNIFSYGNLIWKQEQDCIEWLIQNACVKNKESDDEARIVISLSKK